MSGNIDPHFHYDVHPESEVTLQRRAIQKLCGQVYDLQAVLLSKEPKYVPIRTYNGFTEIWLERKNAWVPVMIRDGEVSTKEIHDAIREWEVGGR